MRWIIIAIVFVSIIAAIAWRQIHRSRSYVRVTTSELESEIKKDLPLGSTKEEVSSFLDSRGIGHAYAGASPQFKNTEIALVRNAAYHWPIRTDIQILFTFDKNSRLSSFTVKEINTGP